MGYLDGFLVTFRKWAGVRTDTGRRLTLQYPEEVRPKPERFHGRHVLNRYEDGMEKCIGCELCAGVCPARCIYVRGRDNDPDEPTSPGERYGFVYEINYLRCIHCDLCVEACPTEAITETKLFEFAFTNRSDGIYTKDELLVGDDGRPQQLPWENWEGGFDPAADTSGWMRATAPSGDAGFEGIVAWSAELGYGVRAPERLQSTSPDAGAPTEPPPAPPGDHHHGVHVHGDHEGHGPGTEEAPPAASATPTVDQDHHEAPDVLPVAQVSGIEPVGAASEPTEAPDRVEVDDADPAVGRFDLGPDDAVATSTPADPAPAVAAPADGPAAGRFDLGADDAVAPLRPAGGPEAAAPLADEPPPAAEAPGDAATEAPDDDAEPTTEPRPEPEPEPGGVRVDPSRPGMFDLAPEEVPEEPPAGRRGRRRRKRGDA